MIIWLYQYIMGHLTIEVYGASKERFVNMCTHHGIKIWDLIFLNDKYQFKILKKDFIKLRPIQKKTDAKIKIIEKYGFPFICFKYRKRKLFLGGICIFCFAILWLSQYIWYIDINGNQTYTETTILTYLNNNDVHIISKINEIDCDNIVSGIRAEFENITWASVYINGCKLMITIKENDYISSGSEDELKENEGMDIVAQESGIIYSIITTSGTPLVHAGDVVEEGDVLVSGCLEIYNDNKEITGYKYVISDAEIYLNTSYEYKDVMTLNYVDKVYTDVIIEKEFVRICNFFIIELDMQELPEQYDIISTENSLLSQQQNSWYLSIGKILYHEYKDEDATYTDEEVQIILNNNYEIYCDELNEKKVEIIENNVNIYIDEKYATASGTLDVLIENTELVTTETREEPFVEIQEGMTQ